MERSLVIHQGFCRQPLGVSPYRTQLVEVAFAQAVQCSTWHLELS